MKKILNYSIHKTILKFIILFLILFYNIYATSKWPFILMIFMPFIIVHEIFDILTIFIVCLVNDVILLNPAGFSSFYFIILCILYNNYKETHPIKNLIITNYLMYFSFNILYHFMLMLFMKISGYGFYFFDFFFKSMFSLIFYILISIIFTYIKPRYNFCFKYY